MLPQTVALLDRVGRRVAEIRAGRGWTQEQFAERLDVLPGYVARIEGGRENLSVESLVKLALELRVEVADLLSAPASRARRRPGRPKKKRE